MEQTPNFNIPIPDPDADPLRNINEEFLRLAAAWLIADAVLKTHADGLAGKANSSHGHQMGDIAGLVSALSGKLDSNAQFSLDDLSDVDGASAAALNYVLVKGINGIWRASSAIAALGPHQHQRSDIVDLDSYVDGRFNALIGGAPDALNAVYELAAAIGNDPNFAVSVSQQIADVKGLVPDHFIGFEASYATANSIVIAAGAGVLGGKRLSTIAPTTISFASVFGSGNGCLDTGVIQASKTYAIYAVRNLSDGTTKFVASLSMTESGVAVPAGYEMLSGGRVALIVTNGSGQITSFKQQTNKVSFPNNVVISTLNAGALGALVVCPAIPVGISVDALVSVDVQIGTTNADAVATAGDAIGVGASIAPSVIVRARTGNDYPDSSYSNVGKCRTDTSARIARAASVAGAGVGTVSVNFSVWGWDDWQCKRLPWG
ncbi:hypothetical protein [Rhizobium sp. SU303]|uniref:hypothetical protein n=1 Tax=Rhizobium sp. SU303 TaxID=3138065 RepID=UPI001E2D7C84|nr:hypothetical protein [Rhizobium leguminosarum]UFW80026.1 hypothetical protein RlegSU303_08940 [Rhizobium leguminosarum bv. viciae]